MKKYAKHVLCIGLAISAALSPAIPAAPEVELKTLNEIELEEKPLDIAVSIDGMTAYILGKKNIHVYSMTEGRITDTVLLNGRFSQIAVSPDGETLLLTDTRNNQLSIIKVIPTINIKIGDSPIIGNSNATVTIFAFMDYQ